MSQAAESDVVVLSSSDGEDDHQNIVLPSRRSSRSAAEMKTKKEADPEVKSAGNGKNTKKRKREEEKKTIPTPISSISSGVWNFPMSRMRRLIACGDGTSGSNLRTTLDSVFIIDQAAKLFLEGLIEEAYEQAKRERKKSLYYKHLSSTVGHEKRYEFLSDFLPEKVIAKAALKGLVEK